MRVLSVRQPWAHAIISLGKDVENRSWPADYRGRLLIHAGRKPANPGAATMLGLNHDELPLQAIVGIVQLVDCQRDADSRWAKPGMWHWVLDAPLHLDPIPCTGQRRLFKPPATVREQVASALGAEKHLAGHYPR